MRFSFPIQASIAFLLRVTPAEGIERLYSLKVSIIGVGAQRHERPHKPLLLLAVFDLMDEGKASSTRIPWCQELRDRFTARFLQVRSHDDKNTPDNPFQYLQTDRLWQAWTEQRGKKNPLVQPPLVSQMGHAFASFTDGFEQLTAIPAIRQQLREALIARYFPHLHSAHPSSTIDDPPSLVADEPPEFGRSPAFRRKILEIYDHQCAACGLRIRLPSGNDVSFIDAAHLIPFYQSHNDHPTNGLALCKNHHWAMDRDIIAPGPDHHWHVAKTIDPRRSTGEKELHELSGKSVLLPKDPAFHPNEEGLKWRWERVCA